MGSSEGFIHTTACVTPTKVLQHTAWVAVQGDPEHRGVYVGVGVGDWTSCLEVKEGMGQSLGKVALSREQCNAAAERAEPTNTPALALGLDLR